MFRIFLRESLLVLYLFALLNFFVTLGTSKELYAYQVTTSISDEDYSNAYVISQVIAMWPQEVTESLIQDYTFTFKVISEYGNTRPVNIALNYLMSVGADIFAPHGTSGNDYANAATTVTVSNGTTQLLHDWEEISAFGFYEPPLNDVRIYYSEDHTNYFDVNVNTDYLVTFKAESILQIYDPVKYHLGTLATGYIQLGDIILPNESPTVPVPEPTTMLLLASGLAGLAGFRRKFRKN